jgi:N-acylneuraminate cytidylyltransferase/CMP-N,N'-diacetyllegionaminic acid synthase
MRTVEDIDCSISLLETSSFATSIVGVGRVESQHPCFLVYLEENGRLFPYKKNNSVYLRRQDVDQIYFYEGTIYVSRVDTLLKEKTFYQDETIGYLVPKWKSLEIDDIEDFIMVESMMKFKGYK